MAFFDTAGSAEEIATKGLQGVGAIASAFAAKHYGLNILIHPLANLPGNNFTRFFAIQKTPKDLDVQLHTKSSLLFIPRQNEAGILHRCLGCFASRNIDLIRIESRPKTGSPWEYVFYLDFAGNLGMPNVQAAMAELESLSSLCLHLGSYPDGEHCSLDFMEHK